MFISHKSNVIQHIHESEWQCRRLSKGLSKPEYWEWLATITSDDDPYDVTYPSEDFTIVECTDENIEERFTQLDDYFHNSPETGKIYNIKYYASKRNAEEILGEDGKSQDPKVYVQSHFVGDDSAKDARLLAAEWVKIRAERDRLIAETDWMMLSDTGTVSTAWKNYRKALREIPQSQDSVKKFSDIKWPDKPSS